MTHAYGGRSSLAQGATSSNSILPRWSTIAHISGSRSGRVSNYSASSHLPPQRVLRFPSTLVSTRDPAPRRPYLRADGARELSYRSDQPARFAAGSAARCDGSLGNLRPIRSDSVFLRPPVNPQDVAETVGWLMESARPPFFYIRSLRFEFFRQLQRRLFCFVVV